MELDAIDKLAAKAFEGYIVRKDLVRKFKGQYPVPTYVAEFLLGRYCSSTDEKEIEEGLQIVQRQLADRTVRPGEEEYFKSKARESGSIRIIDIITARLDAKTDSYVAELPSLRLRDVRITPALVQQHDRMLTGGFYAEIEWSTFSGLPQSALQRAPSSERRISLPLTRTRANKVPMIGNAPSGALGSSAISWLAPLHGLACGQYRIVRLGRAAVL